MKPASSTQPFRCWPGDPCRPILSQAALNTRQNSMTLLSSAALPSSLYANVLKSWSSIQPPGTRFLINQHQVRGCEYDGSNILIGLTQQLGPVLYATEHIAQVNEVERLPRWPWTLRVINLELHIWRYPTSSSALQLCTIHNKIYHLGWIGLNSFPITCAFGNLSPISIAQIPVPVPMSSIRIALSSGSSVR